MKPIDKEELVALIAEQTRLKPEDVSGVLKALGNVLSENMHRGVSLPGVGEMRRLRQSQNSGQSQHEADTNQRDITVVFPDSSFEDKVAWNVAASALGKWLGADAEPGPTLDEHTLSVDGLPRSTHTGATEEGNYPKFKIGGTPDWIQSEDTPKCCGFNMTFYAQLDTSFPNDFAYWDCAMIYVFVCTHCGSHATKVQSY